MTYSSIALQYCRDIVSGTIPACRYVRLACQRHLDDLDRQSSPDFPYRYDEKKAEKRCTFSEKFPHVKGKWAGKKLQLEPWQVFIECAVWGWVKKSNSKRRFRTAYIEVPRKNGKSLIAATSGLYMLVADGEHGAEVYSGASTEKQALEVFRPAWLMADKMEAFREHFGVSLSGTKKNPTSIYRLEDMSRFELVIGEPPDGASPHCAIVDEYHEHRTSDQYDTMQTGMGAREQPLMYVITTAGTDTTGPCYDLHLRCVKILEGTIEDETTFCIIFGIDQEDNWQDFEVWKKANPNYGVSIDEDFLRTTWQQTLTNVSVQNINLCKHLNQWVNAGQAWMNMTKWAACAEPSLRLENFRSQSCYAALDLASKIDICALILLFFGEERTITRLMPDPESGEETEREVTQRDFIIFGRYYIPEETVHLAGHEHYEKWVKEGLIIQTPGARTDFAYIEDDLKAIHKRTPITELAFDPREANYLINNIMQWIEPDPQKPTVCIEINQGPALMSEPMKEVEARVYSRSLLHNGDPVLTWMMGNVVKKQGRVSGPVKYYYPTKEKDENKIDGCVAMIMAVGRAMLKKEEYLYSGRSLIVG